jgi:glycosyltransferase involved in cell wall biosynthesis
MTRKYDISFVMPMYNESENIEHTIGLIKGIASEISEDHEIVVVDDASTDDSAMKVENIAHGDHRIKLFRMAENTRFGGAFAEAFKKAEKEIIVYMDSDLPVGKDDIKASVPLIEGCHIVTGYSKVNKGENLLRKVISRGYNMLVEFFFGLRVRDINSGYKVVRKSLVEDMDFVSRSPFVDVELFIHAKKKGYNVKQYPLIFRSRTGGVSHIARMPVIFATFRDMLKVRAKIWRKIPGK